MKITTLSVCGITFLYTLGGWAEPIQKTLSPATRIYSCSTTDSVSREVDILISKSGESFSILASSGKTDLFRRAGQRPSLNVRTAENSSVNEFVDFNDEGLVVVPVGGPNKLEVDITPGLTLLHYRDSTQAIELNCVLDPKEFVQFLGIAPVPFVILQNTKAVAFDIDDTLMFTSPAFTRGFATGGSPKPDDILFWTHTNGCDAGCSESEITLADGTTKILPANMPSTPKAKALELIQYHRALGHQVYAITARPDINGDPLRAYLEKEMGIARKDIFFEPDIDQTGNVAGKTDRIENLNLDIFYGDSDSDITDSLKAFSGQTGKRSKNVQPIRFFRSPNSSNRKSGELNKYHPGYFGEPILADSY